LWLEKEESLYWITGKAGSGKSTLMKFLQRDPRTAESLRKWAGTDQLVIGWFYFWNSGSAIQRSLEGLLRTLLYNVAKQLKDCIPQLSPQRWEMTTIFEDDTAPWTMTEYLQTLKRLARPEFQRYKFAFFVDGLDEFEGNHEEVVLLLKELSSYKHIKICASSRPWVIFEDAFDMNPSLRVEDLTTKDIELYVDKTFHESERFLRLEKLSPTITQDFGRQISQKASGVFLWVRLVVRELLEGIRDGDRVSDLQRRLDAMPGDLYAFFNKILSGIEDGATNNFEHASQLFRIKLQEEISIFALALADDNDPSLWTGYPITLSDDEILWMIDSMKRRLNTRTKGLLEVKDYAASSYLIQNHLGRAVDPRFRGESKVQYLHRTVKDFIETPDTMQRLKEYTFDPNLALCKSFALQIKFFDIEGGRQDEVLSKTLSALNYATKTDAASTHALHDVLDALNSWVDVFSRHHRFRRVPFFHKPPQRLPVLLPAAMERALHSWVLHCLHVCNPSLLINSNKSKLKSVASWLDRQYSGNESAFLRLVQEEKDRIVVREVSAKDKRTVDTVRGTSDRPRNMNHAMLSLSSTAAQSLVSRTVGDSGQTCAETALTDVELSDSDMPYAIGSLPRPVLNKVSRRREAHQRKRWRLKQRLKGNTSSRSEEEIMRCDEA
jgi:NACHT domain